MQSIPREPFYKNTTTLLSFIEEAGFNVSPRMLQRDLEKLSQYYPINCDKSEKPYRWSYPAEYKSNLPALDSVTALSWVMAEEHLKPILPAIAFDKLQSQFKNARAFLEGQSHNYFRHWKEKVKVLPNGKALMPPDVDQHVWQNVTEALLLGRVIEIDYLSREKKTQQTLTLHPLALAVRDSTTYLLAMINEYDDVRHLALHRIKASQILSEQAREKPDFDFDAYIQSGVFGYPIAKENIQLEALIDKEVAWHLEETPLSLTQQLIETDNPEHVRLVADVPYDQQTFWWLLGFGSKVEVIKPS
ncbi:MAG: WYL domain-containing protein, partial [Methyloprofundus sp.]|nr:WYL domain-containing protein [Methyloprofundus sp.]